ncbi:MAG: response regulator [Acidobacteriota bacterium]
MLFVDDDEQILRVMKMLLHDQPWNCHFCSSVDEALELVRQTPFDTVVADVRMPGKDGFELLRLLRSMPETERLPVVMMTGDHDEALKRRALDLGATDLLTKPIHREDLLARIRSTLRLKEYEDRLARQVEELDLRVRERTRELELSQREIILRLAKAAEFRDDATGNHVVRVALASRVLAEGMGLPPDQVELIALTSPLHDIGKLGVPDAILLKEGRLNPEERRLMESHCEMGAQILSHDPKMVGVLSRVGWSVSWPPLERLSNPLLETAASIAYGHHERWDGRGYPRGLRGEEIPIECRIVAVADVFDALTSWRPYKPPADDGRALELIRSAAGESFDPQVVTAFVEHFEEIRHLLGSLRSGPELFD